MLIVALVLALIGLGALVLAVVTSNEMIAWVCIGASVIGVVLLIVDALRDRAAGDETDSAADDSGGDEIDGVGGGADDVEDYPDEPPLADESDTGEYDPEGEDVEVVGDTVEVVEDADEVVPDSDDPVDETVADDTTDEPSDDTTDEPSQDEAPKN